MILNYTLGLSIFAGLLIGAYSQAVSHQIRTSRKTASIAIARLNADSGLELGKFFLLNGATRAVAGTSSETEFDGGQIYVKIENEAGKIDLNTAPLSLVALGLDLADLSQSAQQRLITEITRMRATEQQFTSTEQLLRITSTPADFGDIIPRVFTVHSGNRFVTTKYAHPKLREVLLARQRRFPNWFGDAVSGANTVISAGYSTDGTVYFQSALLKPKALLNSGFEIVSIRELSGVWVTTEDDPRA